MPRNEGAIGISARLHMEGPVATVAHLARPVLLYSGG